MSSCTTLIDTNWQHNYKLTTFTYGSNISLDLPSSHSILQISRMSAYEWIASPIQPTYYYVDYNEESKAEGDNEDELTKLNVGNSQLILPLEG